MGRIIRVIIENSLTHSKWVSSLCQKTISPKNNVKNIIRKAKLDYCSNIFSTNIIDLKKTWKTMKILISNNAANIPAKSINKNEVEYFSPVDVADIFN